MSPALYAPRPKRGGVLHQKRHRVSPFVRFCCGFRWHTLIIGHPPDIPAIISNGQSLDLRWGEISPLNKGPHIVAKRVRQAQPRWSGQRAQVSLCAATCECREQSGHVGRLRHRFCDEECVHLLISARMAGAWQRFVSYGGAQTATRGLAGLSSVVQTFFCAFGNRDAASYHVYTPTISVCSARR